MFVRVVKGDLSEAGLPSGEPLRGFAGYWDIQDGYSAFRVGLRRDLTRGSGGIRSCRRANS